MLCNRVLNILRQDQKDFCKCRPMIQIISRQKAMNFPFVNCMTLIGLYVKYLNETDNRIQNLLFELYFNLEEIRIIIIRWYGSTFSVFLLSSQMIILQELGISPQKFVDNISRLSLLSNFFDAYKNFRVKIIVPFATVSWLANRLNNFFQINSKRTLLYETSANYNPV